MGKKYYLTTPLYYVNDLPHIGHSYTSIAADVLARFKRFTGYEVLFLTGTDEHGQKVAQAAKNQNQEPLPFIDKIVPKFKDLWQLLEISYDDFIRTTEDRHTKVVTAVFEKLYQQQDIYPGTYQGWYCTPCETFWQETQLQNGLCPDCQRETEKLIEETYFFKMSKYQQPLLDYIQLHPDFIQPEYRRKEMVNIIRGGLKDLSVTRPQTRCQWGIICPFDKKQVIYVWIDALLNYITAPGYIQDEVKFNKFWPADVHLIGKDILKFHAIIWPAILLALKIPLPKKIFAHGWWTVNGKKMSKSRGNVVNPVEIVNEFGIEAYRYFLLREVPFGQDGDFSLSALTARYNADLAHNLGNLLNRTLNMINKYFTGVVPAPDPAQELEKDVQVFKNLLPVQIEENLDNLAFNIALEKIWGAVDWGNRYIERMAPWKLVKQDKKLLSYCLYNVAELIRLISILIWPFMPQTSTKIHQQLGLSTIKEGETLVEIINHPLAPGTKIKLAEPLFPKIITKDEKK